VDGVPHRLPALDLENVLWLVNLHMVGARRGWTMLIPYTALTQRPRREGDATNTTRILMVEDHAFFSGALELVLGQRLSEERPGRAEIRRATTVDEAMTLASEGGPFDLAVVDLVLPDGHGTEVVRHLKASNPETRVAVLSSVGDLSGALEAGADEAIHKSTPLTEIVAILERLASDGERAAT
jgi:DNA-binding NarL/FixJ family response regulator